MKSIIQNGKFCYLSNIADDNSGIHRIDTEDLDKHHIFNGPFRDWSEKNGLWVYLSHKKHMELHQQPEMAYELKRIAQYTFEKTHSREEFLSVVRKNYLAAPLSHDDLVKYGLIETEPYVIE